MKRRHGFTLVELLVVIAIISLLVALLLPILHKVRRKGTVLISPIAYQGKDYRVYLTSLTGGEPLKTSALYPLFPGVRWSPSGQKVAFGWIDTFGQRHSAIVDPLIDRLHDHLAHNQGAFYGWVDSNTFVECGLDWPQTFYFRDADTGTVVRTYTAPPDQLYFFGPLSPVPPFCKQGTLVTICYNALGLGEVVLLKKDLSIAKCIWYPTANSPYLDPLNPQIDPTGEWAAWYVKTTNSCTRVAFKQLSEPSARPPTILDIGLKDAAFCDWTIEGHLLVAGAVVPDSKGLPGYSKLFIYERSGRLVRDITLAYPIPRADSPSIVYRKYGHY